MEENNNNSGNSLGGLIWMGILGFTAYKLLKSRGSSNESETSRKRLSYSDVDSIVSKYFYFSSMNDDEMVMSCFSLMVPDILGVKKQHYDEMLLNRINSIKGDIMSILASGYEGYNPNLEESHLRDLLTFIRCDCYNEIKDTKFICQLEGKVMSYFPGMKYIGKAKNANIDYKVVKSIKRGLIEFFSTLYVYGGSFEEAKDIMKQRYVNTFFESLI